MKLLAFSLLPSTQLFHDILNLRLLAGLILLLGHVGLRTSVSGVRKQRSQRRIISEGTIKSLSIVLLLLRVLLLRNSVRISLLRGLLAIDAAKQSC